MHRASKILTHITKSNKPVSGEPDAAADDAADDGADDFKVNDDDVSSSSSDESGVTEEPESTTVDDSSFSGALPGNSPRSVSA